MGQALVDQVEASVEEAVNSATWTDIQVEMNSDCTVIIVVFGNYLALTVALFAAANSAQLPDSRRHGDIDQSSHEEH